MKAMDSLLVELGEPTNEIRTQDRRMRRCCSAPLSHVPSYTLWRQTFTPAIRSCWTWPASAGAQRRSESEENFAISCAKWSVLDTRGERRRAAPKASPKKILRFWSLKWSILSGFSCARGRRCQVFLFENPRFLPSFLNGCFLNGVLALYHGRCPAGGVS